MPSSTSRTGPGSFPWPNSRGTGNRQKARLLLQTAVEDYPEDAHCDEARQRLQALGGPVEKQ